MVGRLRIYIMNETMASTAAPAFIATGDGNGSNDWMGMLLVIALLGGGGGLFGRGGDQGLTNDFLYTSLNTNMNQGFSTTNSMMAQGFNDEHLIAGFNQIMNGQIGIQRDILTQNTDMMREYCNGTASTNQNIANLGYQTLLGQKDVQYTTQAGLADNRFAAQAGFAQNSREMAECCCGLARGQDKISFEAIQNKCDITNAINAGNQRILDWLSCNELKEANAEIARLNAQVSEDRIIAAMKPKAAEPAYLQPSPYAHYYPYANGCGTGCGTGCGV